MVRTADPTSHLQLAVDSLQDFVLEGNGFILDLLAAGEDVVDPGIVFDVAGVDFDV